MIERNSSNQHTVVDAGDDMAVVSRSRCLARWFPCMVSNVQNEVQAIHTHTFRHALLSAMTASTLVSSIMRISCSEHVWCMLSLLVKWTHHAIRSITSFADWCRSNICTQPAAAPHRCPQLNMAKHCVHMPMPNRCSFYFHRLSSTACPERPYPSLSQSLNG